MLYGIYESEYDQYGRYKDEYEADSKVIFNPVTNLSFEDRIVYPGEAIADTKSMSTVPVYVKAERITDMMNLYTIDLDVEKDWQELYKMLVAEYPDKADDYLMKLRQLYNTSYIDMEYAYDSGSKVNTYFKYTYTIEGDVLHCRRFSGINEDLTIKYCDPEITEDYRFGFQGTSLVLERNGCSVILEDFEPHLGDDGWTMRGCVETEDQVYQNIAQIDFYEIGIPDGDLFVIFTDGSYATNPKCNLTESNHMTVTWEGSDSEYKKGTMAEKAGSVDFRFINCTTSMRVGFALIDESGKVYPYMTEDAYFRNKELEDVKEEKRAEAVSNQNKIINLLQDKLKSAGIQAKIDANTGAVSYDSSVLFAVDVADLSAEGKASMDKFLDAYVPVVLEYANSGTIGTIQVDGHTDTNGTHDYNQDLSERRAASVAEYMIQKYPDIAKYVKTAGYSYDRPIFAEDGRVDMDASRRVEFRFTLNVGN